MMRDELLEISREPNVRAFLDVIAACEGTAGPDGYRTMFGGSRFDSFAAHPNRVIEAMMRGKVHRSSAAGRYQFIAPTWRGLVARYGFTDFGPDTQDAAAVALIIGRGALEDIRAGRLDAAVHKCREEWASFPGSPHDQPTKTPSFVRDIYLRAGGRLDGGAPIEARTAPPTIGVRPEPAPPAQLENPPMAPLAIPLVSALIGQLMPLIPELARVFTDKAQPVSDRNLAAGMKVLDAVTRAAGASGPAAAVEAAVQAPETVGQAVRREVLPMIELAEAGGGGIQGARDFAAQLLSGPGWQGFGYGLLLFVVAIGVVIGGGAVMGYMLLTASEVDKVTNATILDYFKAAGFIVLGFLFGTSRSSQRKDDVMIRQLGERQ